MMNKEQLKRWAIALELELEKHRQSKAVAELCEYRTLMESIQKAKAEAVGSPVDLRGLSYYFFETGIRNFKELTHALNCFSLLMEGYALPPTIE